MKKALDYVSDYQLKSACKDATCIASSKVTQMIFAVLEDWYHHIVLTYSFKLVNAIGSIRWSISENHPVGADISHTSQVIANFVPNFFAMATGVGRG